MEILVRGSCCSQLMALLTQRSSSESFHSTNPSSSRSICASPSPPWAFPLSPWGGGHLSAGVLSLPLFCSTHGTAWLWAAVGQNGNPVKLQWVRCLWAVLAPQCRFPHCPHGL